MIIDCKASFHLATQKPKFSRARVGLGSTGKQCQYFLIFKTGTEKEKLPVQNISTVFVSRLKV